MHIISNIFWSPVFAGWIRTNKILDRESKSRYWLTVYAQDRGTIPRSTWVNVLIDVTDVNDNIPQTLEPVYYPAVMENSPEGTSVVQLQAYDLDEDGNNHITYRITSGNPQGFFTINQYSGRCAFFVWANARIWELIVQLQKREDFGIGLVHPSVHSSVHLMRFLRNGS